MFANLRDGRTNPGTYRGCCVMRAAGVYDKFGSAREVE